MQSKKIHDNDAELYRRFLDGDESAMDELIRKYINELMMYVFSIISSMSIAEEAAMEVFVKLIADKPRFSPGKASFRTWLFTIGKNRAVSILRKNSRISSVSEEYILNIPDETDIEEIYSRNEEKIMLHKAMAELNSDYRQVLYLTFFEDFSNAEAAEIMGKSRRQIENLLYRAKQALKIKLEKEGYSYEKLR